MFVAACIFMVVIFILIILSIIALVKPELIFKSYRKSNASENDTSNNENSKENGGIIGDTKDFVPITELDEYSFCVGNDYRAIIECSSLNYDLMTKEEQYVVETIYASFINSLRFPVDFYIQTREYDSEVMMNELRNSSKKAQKKYPRIADYANKYVNQMDNLFEYIGNSKVKKKFIIISYNFNELADVSSLSIKERKEFLYDELMTRVNIVNTIQSVGIKTTLLNKEQLAQCIFSYYHRDYYLLASDIVNGKFMSFAVNGSKKEEVSKEIKYDSIITEAQNKILNELVNDDLTPDELAFYNFAHSTLEQIKHYPCKDGFELLDYSRSRYIDNVKRNYGIEPYDSSYDESDAIYEYYRDYGKEVEKHV